MDNALVLKQAPYVATNVDAVRPHPLAHHRTRLSCDCQFGIAVLSPLFEMLFNFNKLVSMTTLVTVFSTLSTHPAAVTASPATLVPRAQCAATLSTASVSVLLP